MNDLFVAHLFFERNEQIDTAAESGLSSQIKEAVIQELESVGRGHRDSLEVKFHIDSHENVVENYEGDYFLRLR